MQLGVKAKVKVYKVDLSRAYRQMFICVHDVSKIGFVFENMFYFDCTLSMGSRSSARCCQQVTSCVVFIHNKNRYFLINYLDDLGAAEVAELADDAFYALRTLLQNIGLTEAINKACPPSFCMTFLGIEVNTISHTLKIPEEKMHKILIFLQLWGEKNRAMKRETQQLARLLNFASRCVCSGRVYLARILNFLRSLPETGSRAIPQETQDNIRWWQEFAPTFNGISLMIENDWTEADTVVSSDSCLTGGGAICDSWILHFEFPEKILQICSHINQLEFVVLVVALAKWAPQFGRKRIIMKCDNESTVLVLNSSKLRDPIMQCCLRHLHKIMGNASCEVKAEFCPGSRNRISDSLSRIHLHPKYGNGFKELTHGKSYTRDDITMSDFEFLFRN